MNTTQTTLKMQYETVRDSILRSHVSQFGDLSFQNDIVADFLGNIYKMNS